MLTPNASGGTPTIAFYAPFKPLDHPHPSGDVIIGRGLCAFLSAQGYKLFIVSRLRSRLIFERPWIWPRFIAERGRVNRQLQHLKPDLWLSFHTYYKGPDLLGPAASLRADIPYVVFQGIYATKYRRRIRTWPGFWTNTKALEAATHVFTNKKRDWRNLKRLLPPSRLTYIRPGIIPDDFSFDPGARAAIRQALNIGQAPVVITAAMFRPDVKTIGLETVIAACGRLGQKQKDLHLIVVGDGPEKARLKAAAARLLPERVHFVGRVPRHKMHGYFSAGDLFAFPGINESLGMVFLEAQACGLPVVAYDNAGVPEAVARDETGVLVPLNDQNGFAAAVWRLLQDEGLRRRMGDTAARRVREKYDLTRNYLPLAQALGRIAEMHAKISSA